MSKVFNMVGGGGGPAASIFVTGLSETDTVKATKGGKTLTGKWTQKPNPAIVVPDGYTQLEYIESTGTQYINTGLTMENGFHIKGVIQYTAFRDGVNGLFGTDSSPDNYRNNFGYLYASNGSGWFVGRGGYFRGGSASLNTEYSFDVCNIYQKFFCKINGADVSQSAGINDNQNRTSGEMPLFRCGVGSSYTYSNVKLKSFYIYKTEDETALLRNFIPAKRNSDSAIGLYDLVNGVFYTNSGTGTFTAGAEVPQTIGGFLIKPIRDFGTWTVTATDGTKTATQDVLVDVITEYVIEMDYKLWLYRDGDECEDVTGGWTANGYTRNGYKVYAGTKESDALKISLSSSYESQMCILGTNIAIDFSGYSKCCIEYLASATDTYNPTIAAKTTKSAESTTLFAKYGSSNFTANVTKILEIDISSVNGSGYFEWYCTNVATHRIYRVWLE